MVPEVHEEIKEYKREIRELRSVLRYLIEEIEKGTQLTGETLIVKICKQELEINK